MNLEESEVKHLKRANQLLAECGTLLEMKESSIEEIPFKVRDLVEEVKRLQIELGEAQQWIDSEPDWKDQYMKRYIALQDEVKRLRGAIEKHRDNTHRDYNYLDEELYKALEEKGGDKE